MCWQWNERETQKCASSSNPLYDGQTQTATAQIYKAKAFYCQPILTVRVVCLLTLVPNRWSLSSKSASYIVFVANDLKQIQFCTRSAFLVAVIVVVVVAVWRSWSPCVNMLCSLFSLFISLFFFHIHIHIYEFDVEFACQTYSVHLPIFLSPFSIEGK